MKGPRCGAPGAATQMFAEFTLRKGGNGNGLEPLGREFLIPIWRNAICAGDFQDPLRLKLLAGRLYRQGPEYLLALWIIERWPLS